MRSSFAGQRFGGQVFQELVGVACRLMRGQQELI